MKLDVAEALAHPGQEYRFAGSQAIADQEIGGDLVHLEDCAVEGVLMADDEGQIAVRGKLRTVAHAPCANCLEEAHAEGHEVCLDKLVMSYAVMALPIRFLCREDCPGLTYRDPDVVPAEPGIQYPFAGLRQLLENNEEV